MSRKVIRSVKLRKIRRRVFLSKLVILFFLAIGLVVFLVYGSNTDALKIQNIAVSGGQEFINTEVEEYTKEILAGSYFGLVAKKNILLYPKIEIKNRLLETFPRLQNISFELDPFKEHILAITLTERRENGVWCRTQGEDLDCYFIDKEGYVFAPAPTYSEGVVFSYFGYIDGDPLGKQYLESDILRNINTFVRAIDSNPDLSELQPIGLEYVASGEYKILLKSGGYVALSDVYGLVNAYDNLVLSFSQNDIVIDKLDYIDIRIPNKVFYKHKDTETIVE